MIVLRMMKAKHCSRNALGLIFLLACLLPSKLLGQVTFEKTYGTDEIDVGCSVSQVPEGGYLIAGYTNGVGAGGYDICLVKTDSLGNQLFLRTYGGAEDDLAHSMENTPLGGYIIIGSTYSFGAGFHDVYVMRIDSAGDLLWSKTYGGSEWDIGRCGHVTLDSGCVITGLTESFGAGSRDVYLIKTDSVGLVAWERTYGGSSMDDGYSVEQTDDKGYILAGWTTSFGAGAYDVYLIKTDSLGNMLWDTAYGGTEIDMGYCVRQTSDGGYIISGETRSFGAGLSDAYIIRTDSLGSVLWERTYGGVLEDFAYQVIQEPGNEYLIVGGVYSSATNSMDLWLMRLDSLGYVIWEKTYGPDIEIGLFGARTKDGGYVATGYSGPFNKYSVYLVKTNADGETAVIDGPFPRGAERTCFVLLECWPSPFHGSTVISYSLQACTHVTLSIYNITGRLVEVLVNEVQQPGMHQVRWNRESNPSGVYFYRLKACPERSPEPGGGAGEFVETKKMVLID